MFELRHIKGNTYYFEAYTNVGVYQLSDSEVILIDSCDHMRMVKCLDGILQQKSLKVRTILSTHCHVDHICGNKYFYDKYGCELLSSKTEKGFIAVPDLEPKLYYNGLDVNELSNPFFGIDASESEAFTKENIPEGFEIISLPGHSFEMVGVRTPDGVVFLADSVLSHSTWEGHKMPFFYNVNKAIDTMKSIMTFEGDVFVPSHDVVQSDIKELCLYNIEKLQQLKATVYSLSEGRSFEELFDSVMKALGLEIKTSRYAMYAQMLRNVQQALVEEGKLYGLLENNRLVYHTK